MANFSAQEFMYKLERDAAFRSQIGITSPDMTVQELQSKAAAAGFNYSTEEIQAVAETQKSDTLTDEDLEQVAGGLYFSFKLVAVKTISWAHDDEAPKEG